VEATVVQILAKFRADVADFNKRVGEVENQLTKLQKSTNETSRGVQDSFDRMGYAADAFAQKAGMVAAVVGTAFVAMGLKSFQAAAEVEELDTVMQVVGSTTGVTYQKLLETADAIRDNGIEYASAQQMAIKFAKNSLEVGKAADIARVAQDLAVISQANSTDTANRLTHAVLNLNSMMLRNAGVQTTVAQAVRAYSKEHNVAVKSMTTSQKQQAVLDAILKEGAKIAGVYTMSMTNAGKVLRSFPRITKQLQVAFGQSLIKPLGPLILQIYELYKNFANLFEEGSALRPVIDALTAVLQKLVDPITAAVTKAVDFVKNMKPVTASIGEMGAQIQRYLPVIGALGAGLATLGGASLLKAVPVFGALFGALNPVLVAFGVLVALSPEIRGAFMNLFDALKPLSGAFLDAIDNVVGFINILISGLAGAINGIAGVIESFTSKVNDSTDALDILTSVGIAATIVALGLLIKKTYAFIKAKIAATWEIYAAIAAVGALIYIFYKLWNSSENVRKVIIKIAQGWILFGETAVMVASLIFNAFALIVRATANMQMALGKLRKDKEMQKTARDTLNWIDKTNASITGFGNKLVDARKSLDDFNKPIKWQDFLGNVKKFIPGIDKIKEIFSGKAAPKEDDGGADDTTSKALAKRLQGIKDALQAYNDYIKYDFAVGFTKSGESARDAVLKSLESVRKVFDAAGEGLEGAALKKIQNAYSKLDEVVRAMIPQAEKIGAAFEKINVELEDATRRLEAAIQDRKDAIAELSAMMREPFGEPSEIQKGLSSANATVDSIISTYDKLVDVVTKRFTGFDDARKNAVLDYLKTTTGMLVDLAREREKAVKLWEEQKTKLDELLKEQDSFAKSLASSIKDYGTALVDLSDNNEAAVIQAVKTATGVIITQTKKAASGLDAVTKQLRDRLANIKSFAANIRTLLSRGLDKGYIRQLLEAGPEAAGQLTNLLANAGADQLAEINNLYKEISSTSTALGQEMGNTLYKDQVDALQKMVDASFAKITDLNNAMTIIRQGMELQLAPLKDFMANLGKDSAQALYDSLLAKKNDLIALANSIAAAIAAAMASAMASIGVTGAEKPNIIPPEVSAFNDALNESLEANAAADKAWAEATASENALAKAWENLDAKTSEYTTLASQRDALLAQSTALLATLNKKTASSPTSSKSRTATSSSGAKSSSTNATLIINSSGGAPSPSQVAAYMAATLKTASSKRKG
jgi:hypothetical protein